MVPPGPEGYKTTLRLLREAMQMTWTLIDIVAQDGRVMAWVRCEGRHVGEFFGIPSTGRKFSFEAMHRFRVEDEIVREHWAVRDGPRTLPPDRPERRRPVLSTLETQLDAFAVSRR
jgi:predicted ester cyclase